MSILRPRHFSVSTITILLVGGLSAFAIAASAAEPKAKTKTKTKTTTAAATPTASPAVVATPAATPTPAPEAPPAPKLVASAAQAPSNSNEPVAGKRGDAQEDQGIPAKTKDANDKDKGASHGSDKEDASGNNDEMPKERASLSVAATPLLPIGRFGDAFAVGLGGTLGFDYAVHPHVQIIGRTGYEHHLAKSGLDVTLGAVPIWGGARYTFGVNEGGYLEGALGPSILFATVRVRVLGADRTVSDSDVKIGTSLGGGYRFKRVDLGARMLFWDIGHAGDSMGLMATLGYSFASF